MGFELKKINRVAYNCFLGEILHYIVDILFLKCNNNKQQINNHSMKQ